MTFRTILLFAFGLGVMGAIFAWLDLNLALFAIFSVLIALIFSRFFGGLEKERVDLVYYVLGSLGVVLLTLADPFSLDELYDRTAARDYQERVELMKKMSKFPIRPISFSEDTDEVVRQLGPYFRDTNFSTLVETKSCDGMDVYICKEKNKNSLLAAKAANFKEFSQNKPMFIKKESLIGVFREHSEISVFSNRNYSYVFNSNFPAEDVFILLVTQDELEPSFQRVSEIAKKYLSNEISSLEFFKKQIDERTGYGVPNGWKQVSKIFWPYILLVALATKLARQASWSRYVLRRKRNGHSDLPGDFT